MTFCKPQANFLYRSVVCLDWWTQASWSIRKTLPTVRGWLCFNQYPDGRSCKLDDYNSQVFTSNCTSNLCKLIFFVHLSFRIRFVITVLYFSEEPSQNYRDLCCYSLHVAWRTDFVLSDIFCFILYFQHVNSILIRYLLEIFISWSSISISHYRKKATC